MALGVICHHGNQLYGKQSSAHLSSENPTLLLEVILVAYALLTFVSWYMSLSFLETAFIQAISSLIIVRTWTHGRLQTFAYTRAAWIRHKAVFVEFCVLTFISCATLNTLARLQERSAPASHIVLVILRSHPLNLITKLDLAAVAAITACHVCGHHDVCDRVMKRSSWLGSRVRDFSAAILDVILITLQELPSGPPDEQPQNPQPADTSAMHQASSVQRKLPKLFIPHLSSGSTLQGDELHDMDFNAQLVSMWRMACFWASIHGELRKVGAKVRWSAVRTIFEIAKSPVEVSLHFNLKTDSVAHAMSLPIPAWEHQPVIEIPGRSRRSSSATTSPQSFKSAVMQAMEPANKRKILRARTSDMKEETQSMSEVRKPQWTQQSYLQLPGYIDGKYVDALPDTGSSQNLIDAGFLNSLDRSGHKNHEGSDSDRPLVAPDGGEIPSSGTVELGWRFHNEHDDHTVKFNIVQNCSHKLIIGFEFLADTKTLDEELWVKRTTTHPVRSDSMDVRSLPSNLEESECTRRVVNGFANQIPVYASLDTGCEANLMSEACAQQLHLEIQDLPSQYKEVTFANGRQAPLKGQVTFLWKFAELDSEPVSQTCFILENCIHPIIFGVDFVIEYKLFHKHPSVIEKRLHGLYSVGVVGQKKGRRFSFFGKKKPDDPVELRKQQERDEKYKRFEALLNPPATVTTPTFPPSALIAHSGHLPVAGGPVLPHSPPLDNTTSCIQNGTPPSPSSAAQTLPSTPSAIQALASTPTTQSSTQQATAGTTPVTYSSSPIPSSTTSPPLSRPSSPQPVPSNTQSTHPSSSVPQGTSVTFQASNTQNP